MVYLAIVFMLLQLSDIFMTAGVVNIAGPQIELNPLTRWAWATFGFGWAAVAKLVFTGAAAGITVWMKSQKTMYLLIAIAAAVVLWNTAMFWEATR
jgi:hypothetical protein